MRASHGATVTRCNATPFARTARTSSSRSSGALGRRTKAKATMQGPAAKIVGTRGGESRSTQAACAPGACVSLHGHGGERRSGRRDDDGDAFGAARRMVAGFRGITTKERACLINILTICRACVRTCPGVRTDDEYEL